MSLSKELQIGKAGEHFVCFDLIMQGYNAFLADQGLPYDVLVDINGEIKKVQVRSTTRSIRTKTTNNIYRFHLHGISKNVDFFAFVALNIKTVGYMSIKDMIAKNGKLKQIMEFKTRKIKYLGRLYSTGRTGVLKWSERWLEDYSK